MIDHITWTVRKLDKEATVEFMALVGFWPIPVKGPAFEQEVNQVWFTDGGETDVHIVQHTFGGTKVWDHICVNSLTPQQVTKCSESDYVERARATSQRIWLKGPGGIRIEVRKASRELD